MVKKLAAFFIFFLLIIPKVYAQGASPEEFATSYDVIYEVDGLGVTTVTEKINLRNLTSQYYADQFKLTVGSTQLFDIKANDPGGALDVSTQQKGSSTDITVKFNQQVAGVGKVLQWNLQFRSKDFAQNLGRVWEVRAPKITSGANLESYNLTISVPESFGDPSSISPTPKSKTNQAGRIFLTFDKDSLKSSGVSANFGQIQLFDFDLSYHLENNSIVPILTNVALPPDTAYQDVIYQRINPAPLNVTVDDDGNYLAWYRLQRGEKKDINVLGSVKLYTNSKVKVPFLSDALKKKYTKSDKYWEKDNPVIQNKLAEILKDNPTDTEGKVRAIFDFVVNSLKYDPIRLSDSIERFGAVTALNNPNSAVCMEFTDLFIALARAAGIPARELDGFAYTQNTRLRPLSLNKDVLHAWPEYWDDKRGWVMVDPTWENTTGGVDYFSHFDLNHFVFAIKGLSSIQPVPAGSYKYNGKDTHDVKVNLSNVDFLGKPQINFSIDALSPIFAGFPARLRVTLENVGNALYQPQSFRISAQKLSILGEDSKQSSGPIPPFGKSVFDFNVRTKSLFSSYTDEITVLVGGQKYTKQITVEPFFVFRKIPLIVIGVVAGVLSIYAAVLGTLIYRRHLKKP